MMTGKPIYVLAGQSNANGRSLKDAVTAGIRESGGVLVHHAVNGSSLSPYLDVHGNGDWSAGPKASEGELLDQLAGKIRDALTGAGSEAYLAGVIWVQGETDARFAGAARGYGDRLKALHDELQDRFGDHRLVISALSQDVLALRGDRPAVVESWTALRQAQLGLAAANPDMLTLDPDRLATLRAYVTADMYRGDQRHYASGFGAELGAALSDLAQLPVSARLWTGGAGQDWLVYNGRYDVELQGGAGRDTLILNRREGISVLEFRDSGAAVMRSADGEFRLVLDSVERLISYGADDRITMGGPIREVLSCAGNDLIRGSERADSISMGSGDDRGYGAGGDDWVLGGDGRDHLFGGAGDDTLHGQRGDDHLSLNAGSDRGFGGDGNDVVDGHDGDDEVVGNGGHDLLNGGAGNDRVVGAAGNDRVFGNSGSDTMFGGTGNDRLDGGTGRDSIWAGPGDDRLFGGVGHDGLHGGAGDDTLHGGAGDDILTGAMGADCFVLTSGHDRITDFDPAQDILEFLPDADLVLSQQGRHMVVEWSHGQQVGSVTLMNTAPDMLRDDLDWT